MVLLPIHRNTATAHERVAAIERQGGRAVALIADVLNETQLRAACTQVMDIFGRLDGLVNAAGGNGADGVLDAAADVFSMNLAGMKRVMELNVWGGACCRPRCLARPWRRPRPRPASSIFRA